MSEGQVQRLTPKGTGFLLDKDMPIYVSDALPNEVLRYAIVHQGKAHARAHITEILRPHPDRVLPTCPLSGRCGGCQLQHYRYPAQVVWKQALLSEALSEFDTTLLPPICSPAFYWRNKLQLDVVGSILGLSQRDSATLTDIPRCFLVSEKTNTVLTQLRRILNPAPQTLSRIVIREHDGQHMLVLYAERLSPETQSKLQAISNVASIYLISKTKNSTTCLYGIPQLWQQVGDLSFPIGPEGFFQGNAALLDTFVSTIKAACQLTPADTLWDLHAGSGLLGLSLAQKAGYVMLSETHPESRRMGEWVMEKAHISNARYIAASAEDSLKQLPARGKHTLLLDPPRKGCSPELLTHICEKKPQKIVYVSCNLVPFVAAARQLCQAGYDVVSVQLLDMFPHTVHSESVAVFQLRN